MKDIFCEIGVVVGVRAPHVVAFVPPFGHKALKIGYDGVVAAPACIILAEPVMDLFAAIQREHHIVHLPVAEIDDFIIQQHAVRRQGKAEVFVVDGFQAPGIGHQVFYHLPIHQRFSAEEIHL